MTTPLPSGRVVRRLAALFGLALILNFLPVPRFGFAQISVLDKVALPLMTDVAASELPQLQAAVDSTTPVAPVNSDNPSSASTASPSASMTEDRVTGTADKVSEFAAIGVLLDEAPSEPILVRVQSSDGNWGSWRELGIELDEGPDASRGNNQIEGNGAAFGTEPLWVEDAIGYQLNLSSSDVPTAEVALMRDETKRTITEAIPVAGAAVPTPFGIHLRTEWAARPSTTSLGSTVKLAVVHHSASSNDYSPAEVPGVLRSIQAYHMDGRGWSDIAYNFVVDKYGGVWEGRGGGISNPVIGAHAMGFNTNSVGVMMLGDYTNATPSATALESVSRVIGWKLALFNVDPAGRVSFTSLGSTSIPAGVTVDIPRVVGHQNVGATGCPGSIQTSLGQIQTRAQEWTSYLRATMGPVGVFDIAVAEASGSVVSAGWVLDLEVSAPLQIVLASGDRSLVAIAEIPRPDLLPLYPDQGENHGFWLRWDGFTPGKHEICITAINQGYGQNSALGCKTLVVPNPDGSIPTEVTNPAVVK